MTDKISVISAGSWGTALAAHLSGKNYDVKLWAREKQVVSSIKKNGINEVFLPGIKLPENLVCTNNLEEAVRGSNVVFMVTPAQYARKSMEAVAEFMESETKILLASKGIEKKTLKLMHEIAEEIFPRTRAGSISVLSGPTFAREFALGTPSAAVVAGHNSSDVSFIQELLSSRHFRAYKSTDVIGVELGGALKNIVALAVGMLEGAGQGKNTQAALMTRAIAEITRLVTKMGGNPFTVSGLSGTGDLILTCTGGLSRNRQVGIRLGKGEKISEILESMNMVAEGVETSFSTHELARKNHVEMPIVEAVYRVIHNNTDMETTFRSLMNRSLKNEFYGYGVSN